MLYDLWHTPYTHKTAASIPGTPNLNVLPAIWVTKLSQTPRANKCFPNCRDGFWLSFCRLFWSQQNKTHNAQHPWCMPPILARKCWWSKVCRDDFYLIKLPQKHYARFALRHRATHNHNWFAVMRAPWGTQSIGECRREYGWKPDQRGPIKSVCACVCVSPLLNTFLVTFKHHRHEQKKHVGFSHHIMCKRTINTAKQQYGF